MAASGAVSIAAIAVALLILSGFWAEQRFKRFTKLPAHFDISGRATRLASRSFVIWLTPAIFAGIICLILYLAKTLPADQINGDPDDAIILASAIILGAQAFVLWLIMRWSRGQA